MALITLDNDTKKLQVLLSGAVSASECPMSAVVEDVRKDAIGGRADRGVEKTYDGITTGATAVDLVPAAPSNVRRSVKSFSLYNDDTAAVTVTVRLYVTASTSRVLWYGILQTNENLYYSESRGWFATDENANQKSNASGTSGASSEATSAATSAGTRASVADSKALSVSTLTSTADSKALSVSTLTSTADSKGVSAGTQGSTNKSIDDSRNTSSGTRFSIVESTANSG